MSTLPNIYLSLPVELKNRQAIVYELCERLDTYCDTTGDNVEVEYYIPGQNYNSNVVTKCDIFVFTGIDMPWNIILDLLPSGVRGELKSAMILRKPIYYIYRNKEGELNLYHCIYSGGQLQKIDPIAGTTTHLYHSLKDLKEKKEGHSNKTVVATKEVNTTVNKVFDKRLLL